VPDACTGYVYAMLPKTGGGAVAIGSFLFTDAPARPAIGYFVEAITAIPVRFVNDVSAEVAELTCDGTGVISPSRSTVSAQADGVHIAITDSGEVPVSFTIVGAGGDGAEPGERKETVWQLPPGDATIYCGAISGGGTDASSSANLNVVDPNRLYVPAGLDCASVVGEAGSYAEGATGFSGDPVQVARDHLSGLEFDDLVERALYPESEQPVVRVVRDGAVVATVRFFDDGHGGWLVDSLGRCADTPIGSSEEPAGVSGAPVDPGVLCIDLQVPGESDNIHEGSDLHVDGRHIDFDTGCLVAPAGEPLTILFSNLDEAVQRNISIYTMTPCLRDILAEGTSQVCPPETFELPIFRGEIITGVSEIVYELGPLERGEYYFQDDVHPAANGVLIAAGHPRRGDLAGVSAGDLRAPDLPRRDHHRRVRDRLRARPAGTRRVLLPGRRPSSSQRVPDRGVRASIRGRKARDPDGPGPPARVRLRLWRALLQSGGYPEPVVPVRVE